MKLKLSDESSSSNDGITNITYQINEKNQETQSVGLLNQLENDYIKSNNDIISHGDNVSVINIKYTTDEDELKINKEESLPKNVSIITKNEINHLLPPPIQFQHLSSTIDSTLSGYHFNNDDISDIQQTNSYNIMNNTFQEIFLANKDDNDDDDGLELELELVSPMPLLTMTPSETMSPIKMVISMPTSPISTLNMSPTATNINSSSFSNNDPAPNEIESNGSVTNPPPPLPPPPPPLPDFDFSPSPIKINRTNKGIDKNKSPKLLNIYNNVIDEMRSGGHRLRPVKRDDSLKSEKSTQELFNQNLLKKTASKIPKLTTTTTAPAATTPTNERIQKSNIPTLIPIPKGKSTQINNNKRLSVGRASSTSSSSSSSSVTSSNKRRIVAKISRNKSVPINTNNTTNHSKISPTP
jgi:hypothetical protein